MEKQAVPIPAKKVIFIDPKATEVWAKRVMEETIASRNVSYWDRQVRINFRDQ